MKVFIAVTCIILASECHGAQFKIKNNGGDMIRVGIQGNDGIAPLEGGGFQLEGNQTHTIDSPDNWQGRFWAMTGCNQETNHCDTGDCGDRLQCGGNGGAPPVTLAEITLKGDQGLDYYDISLVDGFNVFASIQPIDGTGDCPTLGCSQDINAECPNELKLDVNGNTVGCKSACLAFDTDEYCCRGAHNTEETCRSSDWPINYPEYFKLKCPDAYTYAYDDKSSLKTCKASKYLITFG